MSICRIAPGSMEGVCACVVQEGQFQVFVMNPNKSSLPPEPAVVWHGWKSKKKRDSCSLCFGKLYSELWFKPKKYLGHSSKSETN